MSDLIISSVNLVLHISYTIYQVVVQTEFKTKV